MLVTRMWLLAGAIWWTPAALAQTTLGALLDAGAKPLPAAQFKEEVVQRTLVGPTSTGGSMEVIYAMSGTIQGRGTSDTHRSAVWGSAPVSGDWTADEKGRICTAMRVPGWTSRVNRRAAIPLSILVQARRQILLRRLRHRPQRESPESHHQAVMH